MGSTLSHILDCWAKYLESRGPEEYVALYVHIPFCTTRCNYCIYASVPYPGPRAVDDYLGALAQEMSVFSPLFRGTKIDALYVGGGSASLLTVSQMDRLFETIQSRFELAADDDHMFCFEVAPQHIDTDKIDRIASSFVNRVSMGVQSFDPDVLRAEDRVNPSTEQICSLLRTLMTSLEKKHSRINVDLMLGLEGQTVDSLSCDLQRLSDLAVPNITVYAKRKRRTEDERIQFERFVETTLAELEPRLVDYDLVTSRGGYSAASWFTRKSFRHYFTKLYRTRPYLNSNLGFGYRAQSFITPQQLWYRRLGDGFVVDYDPGRGICGSDLHRTMFEDGRRLVASGVDVCRLEV